MVMTGTSHYMHFTYAHVPSCKPCATTVVRHMLSIWLLMLVLSTAGMLDLKHAQEWVVTTKLGSSDKRPGTQMPTVPVRTCRFYAAEVMFSFFVLASASYGIFSVNKWSFSIFLTLQGKLMAESLLTSIAFWAYAEAACLKRHD